MNGHKRKKKDMKLSGLELKASTLGWEMALPIIGGPLLGVWIDEGRGTSPRFTLIFLFLGILISVFFLGRYIYSEFQEMKREDRERREGYGDEFDHYDPY